MKVYLKKLLFFLPFWLLTTGAFAQADTSMASNTMFYILTGFILITALLVLGVCIVVLRLLRFMVREQAEKMATEKGEVYEEETESWWDKLWDSANDVVPIEQEEEILLDHDYDGIKELDNHLPPWWKWTFYVSIIFAVVYLILHHVVDTMPLQTEEYLTEVSIAEEQKRALQASLPETVIDESNVEQLADAGSLAKGKQVYNISCAQCHKESGAGGIGPNLTDDYWLHGGTMTDVYRTIKVGVPEKGMISWESTLSVAQMQQVASYIMTLRGTNPDNPKAPQGELFIISDEPAETDSVVVDSVQVGEIADGGLL